MEAIELTFELASPLTRPAMPIHLDAVLLYASIDAGMPEAEARRLLDEALDRQMHASGPVYCASALLFEPGQPFTRFATRHFSVDVMARDIRNGVVDARAESKVDTASGPVRGRLTFIPMMWTRRAKAWVQCRSPDALNELLSNVQYIGKSKNLGFGRVTSILPSVGSNPDAWMRRILPFPVDGAAPLRATVRPPYWDRSSIQDSYMHPDLISGEYGVFG